MDTNCQKNISRIILMASLVQSCGIEALPCQVPSDPALPRRYEHLYQLVPRENVADVQDNIRQDTETGPCDAREVDGSALYADLLLATRHDDASYKINEVISCLERLNISVDEKVCLAERYSKQLTYDRGTEWCRTAEGVVVMDKLRSVTEVYKNVSILREVVSEFAIDQVPANKTKLIQVLLQLAHLHQQQGRDQDEVRHYVDAAVCYQHVLSICGEVAHTSYKSQQETSYKGLAYLRNALGSRVKSMEQLQEEIARDRQELRDLRMYAQGRVDELEALLTQQPSPAEVRSNESLYIHSSRDLFHKIARQVQALLARLYGESEQELGPPPCRYTVMGLGAIALAQMTPYSDVAWVVLMEERHEHSDVKTASVYLRHLTHLVNLRIINLGETIVPNSTYGTYLSHFVKRGMGLDLTGLLGRRGKSYALIQTIVGMLHYLKDMGSQCVCIDKRLAYALAATCYVHGDEALYKEYISARTSLLMTPALCRLSAIHKMSDSVVDRNYSHTSIISPQPNPCGSPEACELQFRIQDVGSKLYSEKSEIYRLPDRLYDLALYYGILSTSGWDAVTQLYQRDIICQEAAHHLGYAVSFASMFRLKTHLHYGQQQEQVMTLSDLQQEEAQQQVAKALCLPQASIQLGSSLFTYYYTVLPFYHKIEALLNQQSQLGLDAPSQFFANEVFYNNSDQANGDIYQSLLQQREAGSCYETALLTASSAHGDTHPDVMQTLMSLGASCLFSGQLSEARQYYTRTLCMSQVLYGDNNLATAQILANVGTVCLAAKQLPEALQHYLCSRSMMQILHKGNHTTTAQILANLGTVYLALDQLADARLHYELALAMYQALHMGKHPSVMEMNRNLGAVCFVSGKYMAARGYYTRALSIGQALYGDNHTDVAQMLMNLADVSRALKEFPAARDYYAHFLSTGQTFHEHMHPAMPKIMTNLGDLCFATDRLSVSLTYYTRALSMIQTLCGDNHPDILHVLVSLGTVCLCVGQYPIAHDYYLRSLAASQVIYSGSNHPVVAHILSHLGTSCLFLNQLSEARQYYERAQSISQAFTEVIANHGYA